MKGTEQAMPAFQSDQYMRIYPTGLTARILRQIRNGRCTDPAHNRAAVTPQQRQPRHLNAAYRAKWSIRRQGSKPMISNRSMPTSRACSRISLPLARPAEDRNGHACQGSMAKDCPDNPKAFPLVLMPTGRLHRRCTGPAQPAGQPTGQINRPGGCWSGCRG